MRVLVLRLPRLPVIRVGFRRAFLSEVRVLLCAGGVPFPVFLEEIGVFGFFDRGDSGGVKHPFFVDVDGAGLEGAFDI